MKKFGGFKVKKVLKEQNRGKLLKCSICCKNSKKSKSHLGGGATAGCAISRCKKTFHFYCAKLDRNARTRRIVLRSSNDLNESDEPQILYRVFCSEEHEDMFKRTQKNIDYSEDTDNEEYKSDYSQSSPSSNDSSDASDDDDSSVKLNKKSSQLENIYDSKQEINDTNAKTEKFTKMTLPKKRLNLFVDKQAENISGSKKLKIENLDDVHVLCFVENAEHLVPSKFEILVKNAKDLFDADSSKVFLWKYNLDRFTPQHMLFLLFDISQALCAKNIIEIKRLVCLLDNKDIEKYEEMIKHTESQNDTTDESVEKDKSNDISDENGSSVLNKSKIEIKNKCLRKKIEENLEKANIKMNQLIGKYCLLSMPEEINIVFLALCELTDPLGEIRYHMKKPLRVKKEMKNEKNEGNVNIVENSLSINETKEPPNENSIKSVLC